MYQFKRNEIVKNILTLLLIFLIINSLVIYLLFNHLSAKVKDLSLAESNKIEQIISKTYKTIEISFEKLAKQISLDYSSVNISQIAELLNQIQKINKGINDNFEFDGNNPVYWYSAIYNKEFNQDGAINNDLYSQIHEITKRHQKGMMVLNIPTGQNYKGLVVSKEIENFAVEREMINIWNEIINEGRGEVQFSNDKTNIMKEAKLLFSSDLDLWRDYCKRISSSKFLMGESKGSDFKASIYWASKSINIRKVLDGCFNQGDRSIKSLDLNQLADETSIISDPIWRDVSNNLQEKLGQATYKSWLSKLKFIKKENQIELQAPNKFIKTWVEDHFKSNINSAFKEVGQGINDVIFSVIPEYVEKYAVK